eukprot:s2157_g16.t1
MRPRHQSKVVFLDDVAGVSGTGFVSTDSSDVLVVAFDSTTFALDFWRDIRESSAKHIFLTSTRQPGAGVFLAEIVISSVVQDQAEETSVVHFEYSEASYEDIFQDATIALHALLPMAPVAPAPEAEDGASLAPGTEASRRSQQPQAQPASHASPAEASPRRLWFLSSFLKSTWRAAKSVARVAVTAVAVVAENLGLTDFDGEKTVTLYTFDASSSLQSYFPQSTCTATSTLEASVAFRLKIAAATLDFATLEVSGTLKNLLEITGSRSYEASQEWKVLSLPPWNFNILIGAVPVIIDIGSYTFKAVADAVVTVGATYQDGQVQRKFELGWDKETLGSQVSFTGRAETLVYLKPVLEITVYKMFKVAFVFKIGYELVFLLEASYNFNSFSCSANLKKYITFDVALNASANFFGRQLFVKDFKLYTNKWKLDDDTGDCSLSPEVTSTSPSTSVATTSLTSSASAAPATDDGCACKKSWTLTSGASCSNYCCALEGHDRHLCIKEDSDCGTNSWGYCPQLTDDGCLCKKSWAASGVQCHDYCCTVDGFDRRLCIKEDSSCGSGNWDYCPAPQAQDGCRCKQTWSTSGTDCQDYCCTVAGYEPHLCFKEDPDCGSNSWEYCLVPRTEDGCKCSKVWASNGVTCNDYCCYLEGMGQHLCIKEDENCGTNHWGYCTSQETLSSRRLAACEEVQFFCNQNACENGQPDCHRCGFCDNFGTTVATTISTLSTTSPSPTISVTTLASDTSLATSVTTSTAAVSSGSNTYELGTLWRGRIWDKDGSCSAFSADLVLQLVQFDDFGHGDGILYFMGATNPVALGSCSVTMFYEASVRGSLPYSTLSPQSDVDFFGECEGFSLPYGWVTSTDSSTASTSATSTSVQTSSVTQTRTNTAIASTSATSTGVQSSSVAQTSTDSSTASTSATSTGVQTSSVAQTRTNTATASTSATSTGVQTSSVAQTRTNTATASTSATSTGVQTSSVAQTRTNTATASTSGEASSTAQTSVGLVLEDGVNVTMPLTLDTDTTWTSAGLHTLSSTVTVLSGVTLTIQGNESLPAAHALVLSFVHRDASIVLHPQAHLVVRNAAFYTPFRGWHQLLQVDGVTYGEPPPITGVRSLSGSAIVVMDNLICKGLKYCLYVWESLVTITNSLFLENHEAIRDGSSYYFPSYLEIKRSTFFRNDRGTAFPDCSGCSRSVIGSLFLQNNIAMSAGYASVWNSTFAQNAKAMTCESDIGWCSDLRLTDVLFYGNDVAFSQATGVLQNITFLDNRLGLKIITKLTGLNGINFLGLKEYHIHYTGTAIYSYSWDLDLSSTYWNTTSLADIYDALFLSGGGIRQILGTDSMPDAPFHHVMYQEDSCAGQCNQHWFNKNWSSLISGGAGTFGFFDPERSLNSGQVLREALLTGHETPSSMSLSSYMQDVAGLLEAVAAFQTVGVSTTTVTASPTQIVTQSSSAIEAPVQQILGDTLVFSCAGRDTHQNPYLFHALPFTKQQLFGQSKKHLTIHAKHTKLGTLTP